MSNSRTLLRKIDTDAVNRVLNGVKHKPTSPKKVTEPRSARSYRGVRRNAARDRRVGELEAKRRAAVQR